MTKKTTRRPPNRFALCIDSSAYPASLERLKLYTLLPDTEAEARGQVRIIDESGEDYLYPIRYFRVVTLPVTLAKLVRHLTRRSASRSTPTQRINAIRTTG